jgi:hypothetical protein
MNKMSESGFAGCKDEHDFKNEEKDDDTLSFKK